MQCRYKEGLWVLGEKSSKTLSGKSRIIGEISDCSLVHVLIISSNKWKVLKTDKSATMFSGLQKLDILTPCWVFFTWISEFEFSFLLFPVVKMNMVVSSELSIIAELNLVLLTAKTTCHRSYCLCGAAVVVMWLSLLAKAGPLLQLRVEATDLAMYCSFS